MCQPSLRTMWPYLDQRGPASQATYNCKTSFHGKTNPKDKFYEEANKDEYYEKANKTTNHPEEASWRTSLWGSTGDGWPSSVLLSRSVCLPGLPHLCAWLQKVNCRILTISHAQYIFFQVRWSCWLSPNWDLQWRGGWRGVWWVVRGFQWYRFIWFWFQLMPPVTHIIWVPKKFFQKLVFIFRGQKIASKAIFVNKSEQHFFEDRNATHVLTFCQFVPLSKSRVFEVVADKLFREFCTC